MWKLHANAAWLIAITLAIVAPGLNAAPFAYVAFTATNEVAVIDMANHQIMVRLPVGTRPRGVAVSQETPRAYVTNNTGHSVTVIDTDSNTVVTTIPVATNPVGVAVSPDGSRIYVANQTSGLVSVIDGATNTVIANWPVSDFPSALALNPDGTRLFVSRGGSPRIHVLDTTTGALLADPWICEYPGITTMHPSGRKVFIACPHSERVVSVDTTTYAIVDDFPVLSWPSGIAISPLGDRLYVVRAHADELVTIDLQSGQTVGAVSVRVGNWANPFTVGISPDGTRAYVTDIDERKMAVVDTVNQSVFTEIATGTGFFAYGAVAIGQFIGGRGSLTAPFLLSAQGEAASARVHFTPPMFRGSLPVTDYEAQCGTQTAIGTTSPITVGNLVNGVPVPCTVRARNTIGFGPPSAVVVATPRDVPDAPAVTNVVVSSGQLLVSFTAPPDNGAPITQYITRCSGNLSFLADGSATSVTLSGLTNGQEYTCTIEAVNEVGTSPVSPPFSAVPVGAPEPPTFQSIEAGAGSLTFTYTAPAITNGAPITGYRFSCVRGGDTIETTSSGTATTFTFTGLENGVLHECRIHARNLAGDSLPSATLSETPADVPGAPVLQSIGTTGSNAILVFDDPSTNGGSAVLDYTAQCLPGPFAVTVAESPAEITGLDVNATYRCAVRARNRMGSGAPSITRSVIPGASGTVADLSITKTNATSFVNDAEFVAYTIVVSNPGPAAVVGARVEDPLTADFSAGLWQCTVQNAAWCEASGTGGIDRLVDLPVGASVTFVFEALPAQGPATPISNQVSVTPPAGIDDPNLMNNAASDGPDIRGIFRDGFE